MFSLVRRHPAGQGSFSRREVLRIGGLSLLGLSDATLAKLRAASPAQSPTAGRRDNACIFVFLFGGPSQLDLWDMKPEAPTEIRGEFRPIDTKVAGIQICEHLPLLAGQMDKLCLVRSMSHRMPVHGPACSEMFTGRPYFGPPTTDQARPEDWPSLASLVTRYGTPQRGLPPAIVLPWYIQFAGQDKRIAGQTGGRMGEVHNPLLIQGDPSKPGFEVPGLALPDDIPTERLSERRRLLQQMHSIVPACLAADHGVRLYRTHAETVFGMLGDERLHRALCVDQEGAAVRQRYGQTRFGQSLLLARRLVEAGVSLVTVNWDDGTQTDKVSPFWDTHNDNFPAIRNRLAPLLDQAMAALVEDLAARGLLETTLVVATGEFGRTPRIGQVVQNGMTEQTGRDHWPHAFTALLSGGGVQGGQAYGRTNRIGAFVEDRPVSPTDLAATILDHLGVDCRQQYWDAFQQSPRRLCDGHPVGDLG